MDDGAQILKTLPQNKVTRGIGSVAHRLFFLSEVRLSNGAFGGRWLTPTHWCAQRLWLKNRVWGGCGKCVCGPRAICWDLCTETSPTVIPTAPQQVSSPLWNAWLGYLSSFSRCVSVSHTSLYRCLCSGRPREVFHNEKEARVRQCVHVCGVCIKVYLALFSPAAKLFPLKLAAHGDQSDQLTLGIVPLPSDYPPVKLFSLALHDTVYSNSVESFPSRNLW